MKKPKVSIEQRNERIWKDVSALFEIHMHQHIGEDEYSYTEDWITVKATKVSEEVKISVNYIFENWDEENYVYAPAAAYKGNKFKSVPLAYPPLPFDVVEQCKNPEIVITDVPRLSKEKGESKMELLVGDLTTPLVGFFSKSMEQGIFIMFEQQSIEGYDNGVCIEEHADKTEARFTISVPGVRSRKYLHMCSTITSDDHGYNFQEQEEQTIKVRIYKVPCTSLMEYFEIYFKIRKAFVPPTRYDNMLPFYEAFRLVENKYNTYNWECNHGFYRSSVSDESICGQWQTGWVGGGMSTYPCFLAGTPLSRTRSFKTLSFIFETIQAQTGLMYGMFCKGEIYGDTIDSEGKKSILLIRKFTDAMYFILKQFIWFRDKNIDIPNVWIEGVQRGLEVLQEIYIANGEFGQFVDVESKEIIVRGTSSAVIGIAALTLGKAFFNKETYLDTAKHAARYYYKEYLQKGICNGAPGEICQCIDSEASFAFLEAYMTLYDVTREKEWINYAKDAAHFSASWCVGYDFKFPLQSQFEQRQIKTIGAVWASIQNKHAAPGICTLSGVSLFKLYRATGNKLYLELFKEITHNLTQYVSTEEKPLKNTWGGRFHGECNPPGFIGERVNLSDWEGKENVGEFPGGSCWCEVSVMLNYVENPGVYIIKDEEEVYCFDHVECEIKESNHNYIEVLLKNPTQYDTYVTILSENNREKASALATNPWQSYEKVWIEKGKAMKIRLLK